MSVFFAFLAMLFAPAFGFVALSDSRGGYIQDYSSRLMPLYYATLDQQRDFLVSRLPPVDTERMSRLEIEFREMLEGILYTADEMEAIVNPRMKAIYEGVAASYYEPAVYRAFEVLYEDYAPLRIAGRMVYGRLTKNMEESKIYKDSQIDAVHATTNLSSEEVQSCWSAFVRLAKDREIAIEKIKSNLLIGDDLNSKKSLTFEELALSHDHTKSKSLAHFLQEQLYFESGESTALDEQRAKHNQRYDDMLEQFAYWKEFIPDGDGEGRRLDILRGCFVGSENPKVVEALRVIYVDYRALRLSGNWIFNVVSTIMGASLRRRKP